MKALLAAILLMSAAFPQTRVRKPPPPLPWEPPYVIKAGDTVFVSVVVWKEGELNHVLRMLPVPSRKNSRSTLRG